MDTKRAVQASKFLSLVLRHKPEEIGLHLDEAGWTTVAELLHCLAARGQRMTREDIAFLVATSDKKRFAFSEDGLRIRANQGHSVPVELGYVPMTPPEVLYHGTVAKFLDAIEREGLTRQSRSHVHLSPQRETAITVGKRRGKPVVLAVAAAQMARAGHSFFRTPNDVWLVERVPPEFLSRPGGATVKPALGR